MVVISVAVPPEMASVRNAIYERVVKHPKPRRSIIAAWDCSGSIRAGRASGLAPAASVERAARLQAN